MSAADLGRGCAAALHAGKRQPGLAEQDGLSYLRDEQRYVRRLDLIGGGTLHAHRARVDPRLKAGHIGVNHRLRRPS